MRTSNPRWVIVCPDARVRHYPYHNEGDARVDADLCERNGCQFYPTPNPMEASSPPCPGGAHTVQVDAV